MSSDSSLCTPTPIALTMGEPAGISGELSLKAWLLRDALSPPFLVIDSLARLSRLANDLDLAVPLQAISGPEQATEIFAHALPVLDLEMDIPSDPGAPSLINSAAVCRSIETAVSLALGKNCCAVVTNPIQKKTLYDAGFDFPGHTEFIAHLTGAQTPVMMLASPVLRVVPITIHQSLASAIADLSHDRITDSARITAYALEQDFGIQNPTIAVAGLNPHAGEQGALGLEEINIIEPAIQTLRNEGLNIIGPVPPDALFTPRMRQEYDTALCHYHDQALIPVKALAVDEAVNVTLNLPIVRTSPDHGTALDIAGKGIAEPHSLICALQMAAEIAGNRDLFNGTSR